MSCHVRYIRALALASTLFTGASGCVEVPADPTPKGAADDASLAFDRWIDEGPARPMTAAPYTGPDCSGAERPGAGHERLDGGVLVSAPGAMDAGAPAQGEGRTAARSPGVGELKVSEVMPNPVGVDDSVGEWVELWNASGVELALDDCALDDGGRTARELGTNLTLAAGAYFVVARSEQAGFVPDVVMSLSLGNGTDSVAVVCGGVEIDRMRYGDDGLPVVAGASLSLAPDGRWCPARLSYGRDLGTPGRPNPPCDADGDGQDAGS